MTGKHAQDALLGLIEAVQDGLLTPAEASRELEELKKDAAKARNGFVCDYTMGDFILIRENALATYQDEYEDEDLGDEGFYLGDESFYVDDEVRDEKTDDE
jgi:hypothetical protein